jgi:hypothetical protein
MNQHYSPLPMGDANGKLAIHQRLDQVNSLLAKLFVFLGGSFFFSFFLFFTFFCFSFFSFVKYSFT